jgi:outer membrane receptor protein involved in Fe transport
MKARICSVVFLLCFLTNVAVAAADQNSADEPTPAPLLDTRVLAVTWEEEFQSVAPASVTVLDRQFLREQGVQTLTEALSLVPGVTVHETTYGTSPLAIRGILPTYYNNRIRLLVNGRPMSSPVVGGCHLEAIPLEAVERIEIIHGPAALLHGPGALAGAVNVVTRSPKAGFRGEATAGGGSLETGEGALSASWRGRQAPVAVWFSGATRQTGGWDFALEADEAGVSGRPASSGYGRSFTHAWLDLSVHAFRFSVYGFILEEDKLGVLPLLSTTGPRETKGTGATLAWERQWGRRLSVRAWGWYDRIAMEEQIAHWPPADGTAAPGREHEYAGHGYGLNAHVRLRLSDNLSWLIGASTEAAASDYYRSRGTDGTLDADSGPAIGAETEGEYAGLMLFRITAGRLNLDLGGRYYRDHRDEYGFALLTTILYNVNDFLHFKLIYGTGYRPPSLFERHANFTDIVIGDSRLEPEVLENLEVAMEVALEEHHFRFSYFFQSMEKPIDAFGNGASSVPASSVPRFANREGFRAQGIEIEYYAKLSKLLTGFANMTMLTAHRDKQDRRLDFLPEFGVNGGLTVHPLSVLSTGLTLQLQDDRKGTLADGRQVRVRGALQLHAQITYKPLPWLHAQAGVRNLTAASLISPEHVRRVLPSLPAGPGRTWYGRVSFFF